MHVVVKYVCGCMYIYMYVCVCICMYVFRCVCMYEHIYLNYVQTHVCIYAYMCMVATSPNITSIKLQLKLNQSKLYSLDTQYLLDSIQINLRGQMSMEENAQHPINWVLLPPTIMLNACDL